MKKIFILSICIIFLIFSNTLCIAGERAEGKYSGVVIFDRWDGCILYSGIYIMYVSEKIKENLRPYASQAVQIDAKEVYQPENPGDGLIRKFEYLDSAPEIRNWITLKGLELTTIIQSKNDFTPNISIIIRNTDEIPIKIFSGELALTLLTKQNQNKHGWPPFDGPSYALITRQSFETGGSARYQGEGISNGKPYSWTIGKKNALPHDFTLKPGEHKKIDIFFVLPEGEYDFLSGYGGGVHEDKSIASNLVAFNVDKEGKIFKIKIKNR